MKGYLREMVVDDLEMVRKWRNHPEIKKFMFNQMDVLPEEHNSWFHSAKTNKLKKLLIYMEEVSPLGFIQFSGIRNENKIVEWGFYIAPYASRGTGTKMAMIALELAFDNLKVHKVFAEILQYNLPSIRLHQKIGFSQEGLLKDHHYDGENYHDVLCFGITINSFEKQYARA